MPSNPDSAGSAPPAVNKWIVAIAVMFGTFMEVLDTTVVNVALPHIAGSMSASVDEATWVLTSYLVANAIILPITGWLASRFGRKNLLMISVTGFTVSSILCGIAPSLATLILFRVIQGASGGCLQPLSQAVLLEAFPPDERGRAMGFWGLGIVVAPAMGPVLGGWLTDNYSWHWIFFINVPVGIASLLMTKMFVSDPPYLVRTRGGVDYWGIGMLAVWVGALQVALDKGQQNDWLQSSFIRWFAAVSLIALIAFLIRELTASRPVVNLHVFRDRTYSTGVFLMTILGFVLYGSLVLLPVWLQTLLGYPAMQAGVALAPRGIGSMIGMPLVGVVIAKIDPRKVLAAGFALGAFTLFDFSRLNLNVGYWDLFTPQFLQGIALSMQFVPLTTITMSQIQRQAMGNATSLFNLMRNIGGSIGIATVTTFNARLTQHFLNRLGENITPYDPQAMNLLQQLQSVTLATRSDPAFAEYRSLAFVFAIVERQAAMLAFMRIFVWLAAAFLFCVPLILLLKRPPRGAPVEMGH